jgi:alkaline phosphatase
MKQRIRRILLLFMAITVLFSGCGPNTTGQNEGQKSYVLTEELVLSLQNTKFTEPKNIIYMIGDGMGENIIQATQEKYKDQLYKNQLAMNYLTKV